MPARKDSGLSVCGCNCQDCDYLKKSECTGCDRVEGKVWWTSYVSRSICPLYECVVHRKTIDNCGICSELPCQIWKDLKDPNYKDEQHEHSINERIMILRGLKI